MRPDDRPLDLRRTAEEIATDCDRVLAHWSGGVETLVEIAPEMATERLEKMRAEVRILEAFAGAPRLGRSIP
jgi:hypothetical protein